MFDQIIRQFSKKRECRSFGQDSLVYGGIGRQIFFALNLLVLATLLIFLSIMNDAFANSQTYDDEIIMVPVEQEHWESKILVKDDRGVLDGVKNRIDHWQANEEYGENWNLDDTGLYPVATREEKQKYLESVWLKYLDKRLAGEVRHAEEGSTLHNVGRAQKALRPAGKVSISKHYSLKFKVRILQMKGKLTFVNPYVDSYMNVAFSGKAKMHVGRNIASIGLSTGVDYTIDEASWVAYMQKTLTNTISTRISSSQSDSNMAFQEESDKKIELIYSRPF